MIPRAGSRPGADATTSRLLDLVSGHDEALPQLEDCAATWERARAGGVDALVAERILRQPEESRGGWRARADDLEACRWAAHARAAVRRVQAAFVLETLAAAGIAAAPIKGMWVAERYYEAPHAREMSDLDVVVGPRIEEALAALRAAGARRAFEDPAIRDYELNEAGQVAVFPPGPRPLLVELHWRLFREQPAAAAAQLLRGAQPGSCAGVTTSVPRHEDQLLISAHHLALMLRHGPALWYWWVDIQRMLCDGRTDWQRLLERAEAWGSLLPLGVVLVGAVQLFESSVPRTLWPSLERRLRSGERAVLRRAVEAGALRVHRDEILAALFLERGGDWRWRSLYRALWPHPGQLARERGQPSDRSEALSARLETALARARRMWRVVRRWRG